MPSSLPFPSIADSANDEKLSLALFTYIYQKNLSSGYASPMEDYPQLTEAVSRVITRLREDAGLSKRRLAMISHLDRVYLLQVEQGKYRPTLNFIFWLAQALGISGGELVTVIEQELEQLHKTACG